MPIRRRHDRRAMRADFQTTPEIVSAFCAYLASEPINPVGAWPAYWELAELLEAAGAPIDPLLGCCCWHPNASVDWTAMPAAVAVYRRLSG